MRYNPVPHPPNWHLVTEAGEELGLVGHNDLGLWTYGISRPTLDPEAFIFHTRTDAARALRRHVHGLRGQVVHGRRAAVG